MERDDLIKDHEYSVAASHDEEHGKQIRKKIWFVTLLLSVVTAVEVALGIMVTDRTGLTWEAVKFSFIIMTVIKAGYIVMVFMHLGDEKKNLKWVILAPYIGFILYLVWICLTEATYIHNMLESLGYY